MAEGPGLCRCWATISAQGSTNPFPAAFLNNVAVLRLLPITLGNSTLLQLRFTFQTEPQVGHSLHADPILEVTEDVQGHPAHALQATLQAHVRFVVVQHWFQCCTTTTMPACQQGRSNSCQVADRRSG